MGEVGTVAPVVALQKTPHRDDIQGLRAVLMLQVLFFHAWFVGSPIGVDAFIMISAFLMTSSFIRRSEAGATPSVLERWATTFKRLLPPLAITVAVTLTASIALLPARRWQDTVDQSFASLTDWQNWLLAHVSTDYFAEDHALASPLQHLWSMSMQGQMFLLWPALMALTVVIARKMGLSVRRAIFGVFIAITALSLVWLVTTSDPSGTIYFDTRARIWEFALGSAIAALAPYLRLPKRAAQTVSVVALGVLVLFCLVSIGTYPGPMAAIPLLATSALLLFAAQGGPAATALSWRPLVMLGNISYSVYLVHWPIFVLYLVAVEKEALGVVDGVALMAVSIAIAAVLTKYVDTPIRRLPWANTTLRKAQIVGLALWLGLTFVFNVQVGLWRTADAEVRRTNQELVASQQVPLQPAFVDIPPADNGDEEGESEPEPLPPLTGFPGAAAMIYPGPFAFEGEAVPGPLSLDNEWVMYEGMCSDPARALLLQHSQTGCHGHGDPANPRVFVGGSSHAEQVLMPAARLLADQDGYYVEAALKAGCPWSAPDPANGEDCAGHNATILQYLQENPVDYVFLIVTATSANGVEQLGHGVVELVQSVAATGATVVGIRDNLRANTDLYQCAPSQGPDVAYGGCLLNRSDHFAGDDIIDPLLEIPGFHYVDVMDLYCSGEVCPTIAGNVQIYLDTNHVTQTYGQTMAPILVDRIHEALK